MIQKNKNGPVLTHKRANVGPASNSTAFIYIYIYVESPTIFNMCILHVLSPKHVFMLLFLHVVLQDRLTHKHHIESTYIQVVPDNVPLQMTFKFKIC